MRYPAAVLLTLLALLSAAPARVAAPKTSARLVVPKALREQREQEATNPDHEPLPLFANPSLAAALGPLVPQLGAWAEYLVQTRGQDDVRVRAAVLGPPLDQGRYWLELTTVSESRTAASARLLVHGSVFRPRDVERIFLMLAGQQPMEIPLDDLPGGGEGSDKEPPPAPKLERLGKSQVKVRAGLFQAEALRVGDTRVWRSPAVPLWGLVRAQSPRQTLELLSSGLAGGHTLFPAGWGDASDQGNGKESVK